MQEIVKKLERNARDVQYGSVGVELRIHEGRVVKTVYRTSTTEVERNRQGEEHEDQDG